MPLPVGLVYDPARKVVLDPDNGAQDALRHVFTVFARTGAARATITQRLDSSQNRPPRGQRDCAAQRVGAGPCSRLAGVIDAAEGVG